jgi:putative peptidoglycan lipid II flippase
MNNEVNSAEINERQRQTRIEARKIGIASLIWASSIMLGRIIGLVREQIIGRTLGASRQADLYFASFTLPDFLNYLLAAGALSIVFIPIFSEYLQRCGQKRGWYAFSTIANFIVLAGMAGIVPLMLVAKPLAHVVAPGFDGPGEMDTLVRLIRIILPAQLFHIVGGLLSAALQAQDRHFVPAMAPLVYSAGIIAGGLIGAASGGGEAEGFAWGVLAGSVLGPFALPLYGCLKTRMRWYPSLSFKSPDLRRYLWLSVPIMVGFSIVVVDEWIVKNQASYLPEGSLAYLQYGRTLMKVPIGVFGMAVGVASYPTLSRTVADGRVAEAYGVLSHAVRLMLLTTFAAQVCLTVAGFEATYLIWGLLSTRFSVEDAHATATVLGFLCLGLSGWAAQTLISRGFYALGNTWLPTAVGTAVAIGMLPFYVLMRQYGGAAGLAVASTVAILIYVFLLGWLQYRHFRRETLLKGGTLEEAPGMLDAALRLGFAAAIAIAAGLTFRSLLLDLLPDVRFWAVLVRGLVLGLVGMGSYIAVARWLGVRELVGIEQALLRKVHSSRRLQKHKNG